MSTTEQKALTQELAGKLRVESDKEHSGVKYSTARKSADMLDRLSAENEALVRAIADHVTVRGEYAEQIKALRAQVEALTKPQEPVAYWIPKAEQFCIADPGGRPFAKAWEPLYPNPSPLTRPAVPEIDYPELISACYRITKRPQGTPGCVHFKAGAEWFRSVMLAAAAPQPKATIKESSRVAQTTEAAQPDLMSIINAQADEHAKRSPLDGSAQPTNPTAENWLRTKYGAYRGHPEWRALEVAFNAGMAAQKGGA